jgi:hypothetical protein
VPVGLPIAPSKGPEVASEEFISVRLRPSPPDVSRLGLIHILLPRPITGLSQCGFGSLIRRLDTCRRSYREGPSPSEVADRDIAQHSPGGLASLLPFVPSIGLVQRRYFLVRR